MGNFKLKWLATWKSNLLLSHPHWFWRLLFTFSNTIYKLYERFVDCFVCFLLSNLYWTLYVWFIFSLSILKHCTDKALSYFSWWLKNIANAFLSFQRVIKLFIIFLTEIPLPQYWCSNVYPSRCIYVVYIYRQFWC